jgi:hypothetical protein
MINSALMLEFFSARTIAPTSSCRTEWLIALTGGLSMQISPTEPNTSNVMISDAAVCPFICLSIMTKWFYVPYTERRLAQSLACRVGR